MLGDASPLVHVLGLLQILRPAEEGTGLYIS